MTTPLSHATPALTWLATLSGLAYFVWGFAERLRFGLSVGQDLWYELSGLAFTLPLVLPAVVGLALLLRGERREDAVLSVLFGTYVLLIAATVVLHVVAADPLELGLPILLIGLPVSIGIAAGLVWRGWGRPRALR